MKKILFIFFLCFFCSILVKAKTEKNFVKQLDLNIKEHEFGVLLYQIHHKKYMVLADHKSARLVLIDQEDDEKNKEILNKLGIFHYEVKNLDEISSFNDIIIKQELETIKIKQENKLFCISNSSIISEECKYTYLFKESNFNDMKLALFYDDFSQEYEELLYEKWVDYYKLSDENITFVKFYEDTYHVINISSYLLDLR